MHASRSWTSSAWSLPMPRSTRRVRSRPTVRPRPGRALHEARRVLKSGGRFAASVPISTAHEAAWNLLYTVLDRWLPPRTEVVDQKPTRDTVGDGPAFRQAALDAGFASVNVETHRGTSPMGIGGAFGFDVHRLVGLRLETGRGRAVTARRIHAGCDRDAQARAILRRS